MEEARRGERDQQVKLECVFSGRSSSTPVMVNLGRPLFENFAQHLVVPKYFSAPKR
jgi:hypothetical protein